jgi:hypothetical protein
MQQVKHHGCSRSGNIVTVQLECVSAAAAAGVFAAVSKSLKAGELHLHDATPAPRGPDYDKGV